MRNLFRIGRLLAFMRNKFRTTFSRNAEFIPCSKDFSLFMRNKFRTTFSRNAEFIPCSKDFSLFMRNKFRTTNLLRKMLFQ